MTEPQTPNLPVARNLKIGLFHLGSGMADVVVTGIWNRIMISDLGYAATPVSLLASLRYFLAPIAVWAGRMSDRYAIFGYHRLFWIWLGRLMMAGSTVGVGVTTAALARGGGNAGWAGGDAGLWLLLSLLMLLFSLGNALSGSTFLALIYDRTPEHQRGRAIGLVWTFLMLGYAFGGFFFGVLLPSHETGTPAAFTWDTFEQLFILAGLMLGFLWFVSMVGEEKRLLAGEVRTANGHQEYSTSAISDLKLALSQRPIRMFMIYLALSMFFAFSQDAILEPFGGQVFGIDAAHTTRFTAYWASTAILGTIVFMLLARRFKSLTNTRMSYIGAGILMVTFGLFTLSAVAEIRGLVTPGLIILGVGLGAWNVGTLGLMMDMSPLGKAGTFLGFWTLVVTLSRGAGVAMGGVIRDVALTVTQSYPLAYAIPFGLAMVGLGVALWALWRAHIPEYRAQQHTEPAAVLAGAMD
jgi:BCD family chlorophyll transporter-like MFS transporter